MDTPGLDLSFRPAILLPDELLIGPSPAVVPWLYRQLAELGVTAILSLQEEIEAPPPPISWLSRFMWTRLPVADGHAGGTIHLAQLERAVRQIETWHHQQQIVYVHCLAGIGRAPTVATAYLMARQSLPLGVALERVQAARPCSSPTAQQLLVLAEFGQTLTEPPG